MSKAFNVILAATNKGEIGANNTIPWALNGDLRTFRNLTMNNTVIVGRHTFESIPKGLPGRDVIVVSSTMAPGKPSESHVWVARDFAEAIRIANKLPGEIFVAGGVALFEAALKFPCTIYLTTVYKEPLIPYDTVIPNFNVLDFEYQDTPIAIFDTDEATGLKTISHTYSVLTSRNHPHLV